MYNYKIISGFVTGDVHCRSNIHDSIYFASEEKSRYGKTRYIHYNSMNYLNYPGRYSCNDFISLQILKRKGDQ